MAHDECTSFVRLVRRGTEEKLSREVFDLTGDQAALLSAIERVLARHRRLPVGTAREYLQSDELERDLNESGFLDIAREDGMGSLEAGLLIEALSKLPFAVETTASVMVSSQLSASRLPRPVALARAPLSAPVRFASAASTVLVDCGDRIRLLRAGTFTAVPAQGTFAYPFARLVDADLDAAPELTGASPEAMRHWWRLGVCFEIVGADQAALVLKRHVSYRVGRAPQADSRRSRAQMILIEDQEVQCRKCLQRRHFRS